MGESVGKSDVDVLVLEHGKVRAAGWGEYLSRRQEGGLLWWVHVTCSDSDDGQNLLADSLGFDEFAVEDVVKGHMRGGLFEHDGHVAFMVPFIEGTCHQSHYRYVGVFASTHEVVTACPQPSKGVSDLRSHWHKQVTDLGKTTPDLLYQICDFAVDEYFPILDGMQDRIEDLEGQVYEKTRLDNSKALGLKRELLVLRKQISPLRDTLDTLMRHGPPLVNRESQRRFQDVYNHILRLSDNIDLSRDILTSIMDAQLAIVSNRLNDVMRILTVISTLMMICSLVAGVYGMNFEHMPELSWPFGYAYSFAVMAVLCLVALGLFKWRKWI